MRADILILGQGIAGSLLGWELERAGIPFTMIDAGPAGAASRVAAGIINPITGRRLVKSWRFDELRPIAERAYGEIEAAWGVKLWREMRVRRLFQDDRERRVFAGKALSGELAPYAEKGDADGFWIGQAAQVDMTQLLRVARSRWLDAGILSEASVSTEDVKGRCELVIDCRGATTVHEGAFGWVPWELTKGQILEIGASEREPGVILNRGQWLLPVPEGKALVGSTHETRFATPGPTDEARCKLAAVAEALLGRAVEVTGQAAGLRVHLPDKHPVAGRHPHEPWLGVINGLGAKGALTAPWLARQWVNHLCEGVPFDPDVVVTRFL